MGKERGPDDVETTLRIERDEAEVRIARYRVWTFAISMVAVVALNLGRIARGLPFSFFNPILFSLLLLYALAMQAAVRRRGALPLVVYAAAVFDPFALVGNLAIYGWFVPHMAPAARDYALYVAPAFLFVGLVVTSTRLDRGSLLAASLSSLVALHIVVMSTLGWRPPLIMTSVAISVVYFVGAAAAAQGRRSLERFAHLQMLRRFLPPAAVERVMRERTLVLGGEAVSLTVLASDLRGFTAMSEKVSPDEVVRQLNSYLGAMLEAIDANGGALDKFMGDGILAIFGHTAPGDPRPADCGARAAVGCARDMQRKLEALNEARATATLPPLAIGIGIHTGPVIAGNIGAPGRRLEFTVIGDAVNTASRLEGLTKELRTPVVISAATAALLPDLEGLRSLPPVTVRGKEVPVELFALSATVDS